MAFSSKALQSIDNDDEDGPSGGDSSDQSTKKPQGPPSASPKPRSAADSSLFSSAGQAASQQGKAGLGAEGSDPSVIGTQGLALVQRGLQMLNLGFPDNPGLTAVLADITGRLQSIIPQLVAGSSNGMGLFGAGVGQGGQPPLMPPAPPMGAGPGGPMPPGGAPMGGPPMGPPPQQGMPPRPPGM